MGKPTFPTTINKLNTYFSVAVPYIKANAARLKVDAATLGDLLDFYGNSTTDGTYMYYYALWSDKTGSRTKQVTDNLELAEEKMKQMLTDIYNDIPASVWTQNDRNTLHRKKGAPIVRTTRTTPIAENCFVILTPVVGGNVKFSCRITKDSTRASKPEGADGIEIAYRIDVPSMVKDAAPELSPKVKHFVLNGPDDNTKQWLSTKASFMMQFGTGNAGNYLQVFARWINTKHLDLSGPWTGVFSANIS